MAGILQNDIRNWLENYKKNSVKTASYDRLVISFKMLCRYPISNLATQQINVDDMQMYMNLLVRNGYSLSTIRKQYNLLTAFFRHAFSKGYISTPIYLGVEPPGKNDAQTKEIEIYEKHEQAALENEFYKLTTTAYLAGILMLETGMRVGEVLALEWDDILWQKRAVRISKTLVRMSSKKGVTFVQKSPKSSKSNRTIPLSGKAMEALGSQFSKRQTHSQFIFERSDTMTLPMSYSSLKYHIKRACEIARIPYKGNHAFRYTFATNCYKKGCDVKLLSKFLGHANSTITYNTYIHLYGDSLEEMRKVIE